MKVGYEYEELLPGLYEYRREGDDRAESSCSVILNYNQDNETQVRMTYGEEFTVQLYTYHEKVVFDGGYFCNGALYRIGD